MTINGDLSGFSGTLVYADADNSYNNLTINSTDAHLAKLQMSGAAGMARALRITNPLQLGDLSGTGGTLNVQGTLTVGAPADLTLIDLNREWTVDANTFASKSRNCPFQGWTLQGQAVMTLVGGRMVNGER